MLISIITIAAVRQASAQGVYAVLSNGLITARLGESGTENNGAVTGRFAVDDPKTNVTIMFGPTIDLTGVSGGINVPGSFVTVRIDGGAQAGGWDLIFGDTTTGVWALPPTVLNGKIIARWATVPGAVATNPVPPIQVNVEITLVHNVVCYKFTTFNGILDTVPPTPASAAHFVGLRFAQNYTKDTTAFENEGPVFLSEGGQTSTETTLTGTDVPKSWYVLDSTKLNPIGGILRPLINDPNFIPVDRLLFGAADLLDPTELWDHPPVGIPGFNFARDAWDIAAAVYWDPKILSPGQSREFVTYFGKQSSTIDFTKPWAAGVEARGSLDLTSGLPTPNPFIIGAFIVNQSDIPLTNAKATITLPKGLALAAGEKITKPDDTGTTVPSGGESQFSWSIVPTGEASGRLSYSVSFAAGPGIQGKVITRTIDVPALPVQALPGGLQMVSFPDFFADANPSVALGLNPNDFALLRWNPAIGQYQPVTALAPGQAYWLNLVSSKTVSLQNATPVPVTSQSYEIRLVKGQDGWNQIGNPFLQIVNWADVQVLSSDATDPNYLKPLTIDEAAAAGLIQSALFRYDTQTGTYKFDPTSSTDLVPLQGYWVKVLRDSVSLLIPPPSGRAAVTRAAAPAKSTTNGWLLKVIASNGKTQDAWNYLGVASGASDGYDPKDISKPPYVQNAVRLQFTRDGWGTRAGSYAQDVQAANGAKKSWTLNVTTPAPNQDVTLSWPEVSTVPKGYELFITDSANGQRRQMRQTSSIRVNTGEASTRSFVITAEPRVGTGVFTISMQGHTAPGGRAGGVMSFDVSSTQDATIMLRIKGASGQTIRTLTGRSASLGSTATFTWDNRDSKGTSVAAGSYIVEVTGTTSDGETRRLIQPVLVVR